MKKYLCIALVFVMILAVGAVSFASTKSNTGCGLGTQIMEGNDGLLFQLLATTTNGIFGNQTFGITSGTLGCEKFDGIVSNEKLQIFVAENMDNLAKDIAKGNGEYINTLAVLMEISESNRTNFRNKLQSNFSKIYTSEEVTNIDVLNNIETVIAES